MIAYNKTSLHNLAVVKLAEKEYDEGLVPEPELNKIKAAYPVGFYSPNIFIRAGLFILTCVISTCACGFVSLLMMETDMVTTYGWLIFLGILNYVALEVIVQQKHHFSSGADDALLWICAGLFTVSFVWATDSIDKSSNITIAGFVFLLSTALTLRFSDRLQALISFLSAAAITFFSWQKLGSVGLLTMPFVLMLFSGSSFVLLKKIKAKTEAHFYNTSIAVAEIASLILLYLAGNYYIVKELGDMLAGFSSKSIPYGGIFWLWTMALPLVYLFLGIRKKKIKLLRLGFLLTVCSVLTFRNYYHLLPVEYALIIAGIIALVVSYLITKYLKSPKHSFTSVELNRHDLAGKLNLESLIISETLSGTGKPAEHENSPFGGGKFGGGGAEGEF